MGTSNTADTGNKGSDKNTKKPVSTTASGSVKRSAPTATGAGAGGDGHKSAQPVKAASRPSSSAGAGAPAPLSGQPGKSNPTPHEDQDPAPPLHEWGFRPAVFKPRNGPPKRIQPTRLQLTCEAGRKMLPQFKLPHLLPLAVATAHAFGGLIWPLLDPKGSILMYGLPERVAESPAAQSVFLSGSIRTSAFGVLVWVFYLQRKLREVDTVNLIMGIWLGFADSYVCWLEGATGQAAFKATAGMLIAGWGAASMTSV